jgi:hypothetical protein
MKASDSLTTIFIQPEQENQYILQLPSNAPDWKTSWYHIDTESCILSYHLPCHIYSKVLSRKRSYYKYYFALFTLMYAFYYTPIIGWIYLPPLICKGEQVVSCPMYAKNDCENSFIIVDDVKAYQCFWSKTIDLCIPTTNQQCIQEEIAKGNMDMIYTCFSIMFLVVFFANYQFRSAYQDSNSIPRKSWKDCLITFFCPVCSNAQIYREYDIKDNDFITV